MLLWSCWPKLTYIISELIGSSSKTLILTSKVNAVFGLNSRVMEGNLKKKNRAPIPVNQFSDLVPLKE
jgi:hypothetical protein